MKNIKNVDDINDLKASRQLLGQLIAAAIVVFYGDIVLTHISAFGLVVNFGIFSELITMLFIVGCINIINFRFIFFNSCFSNFT